MLVNKCWVLLACPTCSLARWHLVRTPWLLSSRPSNRPSSKPSSNKPSSRTKPANNSNSSLALKRLNKLDSSSNSSNRPRPQDSRAINKRNPRHSRLRKLARRLPLARRPPRKPQASYHNRLKRPRPRSNHKDLNR